MKETQPETAELDVFGPTVFAYTRQQAIEDGFLVDVSSMAKEAGLKFPVAMTTTAYDHVRVPAGLEGQQDETGRLWDVLWLLRNAIKTGAVDGPEGTFEVLFLVRDDQTGKTRHETVQFKAVCGPADDGAPCITVMMPDED